MKIKFSKYNALGNDFLVIDSKENRIAQAKLPELSKNICDRNFGVGADGIVYLSASRKADRKFDIYNADGGWAEMSGNGLRIAGLYLNKRESKRKTFSFQTAASVQEVKIGKAETKRRAVNEVHVSCELGEPEFLLSKIPVKDKRKYVINRPMKFGPTAIPVTCLSTGNPHVVLIVDDFDFDWPALGADIESAPQFPEGTNVEFVKVVSRKKLLVRPYERGVGITTASGTGAAAAVCASVIMGIVGRSCQVQFESGTVEINWSKETGQIDLTGPVVYVAEGSYNFSL